MSLSSKRSRRSGKNRPEDVDNDDAPITIHTTEKKLREAQETLVREIQNLNEIPASLRKLSTAAFIFQIFQATFLFIVAYNSDQSSSWYTHYPSTEEHEEIEGYHPSSNRIATFSVLIYAPIFILMSGIEHLSCLIFRETYEWYIARNQNPFRWTEYTFSASLMKVLIGQLAGVTDVHILFSLFMLSALTIQTGASHEAINAKARADGLTQNWRCFFNSWAAHLAVWIILFNYFGAGAVKTDPSGILWFIMIILCLLDGAFAVLFTLQWAQIPPFDDYVLGEHGFIVLSFTAKSLLAWTTVGVFRDNN